MRALPEEDDLLLELPDVPRLTVLLLEEETVLADDRLEVFTCGDRLFVAVPLLVALLLLFELLLTEDDLALFLDVFVVGRCVCCWRGWVATLVEALLLRVLSTVCPRVPLADLLVFGVSCTVLLAAFPVPDCLVTRCPSFRLLGEFCVAVFLVSGELFLDARVVFVFEERVPSRMLTLPSRSMCISRCPVVLRVAVEELRVAVPLLLDS